LCTIILCQKHSKERRANLGYTLVLVRHFPALLAAAPSAKPPRTPAARRMTLLSIRAGDMRASCSKTPIRGQFYRLTNGTKIDNPYRTQTHGAIYDGTIFIA
jgi:hypothetical protein